MITISTAVLGAIGGAVGGLITGLFVASFKRIRGLTEAVKALSHDALFTRCSELIAKGEISSSEMENLTILFEAYHDQGQNGTGEELYNRCKDLPLRNN